MKVQNKVFVVTGAGGGIGGELVATLLERGAKVAAVDLKDEDLHKLTKHLSNTSDRLTTHVVDITDRNAIEKLPQAVIDAQGQVDGIINCAGIIQPFVKINELDYKTIERVMGVNFFGTLYMTKAFLPILLERPEAYVANVSSMGGFLPVPGQSIYGASKAAVKLMTEGLFAELQNTNVHVSIIFPGATDTNITQNSGVTIPNISDADIKKRSAIALSPKRAAKIMIDGIEKNKPQIFTGKDSNMMNRLYRINPVFATKFIAKQMKSLLGN